MGTPYVFGSPSGYTRTFDCSSFTQYIYYQNGIELPRVSRHQAKLDTYVPIEDLRPGHLLYFYWPGRFKSNEIVGHVGIYMAMGT
jgi:cell wall-associated NlpC family hydrolase